jgi:PAS domain-containing protein
LTVAVRVHPGVPPGTFMDTLQILTLKTATAMGKLADLQRRAEHEPGKKAALVIRPALRELTAALEELQVANEHLQAQVDELSALRWNTVALQRRLDEFADALPTPCVWTDIAGLIADGNEAACGLLNISKPRLAGKPLMLFVSDREALFSALHSLRDGSATTVEADMVVRPRERRPRRLRVLGKRLEQDLRCVWFLQEPPAVSAGE